MMEPSEGTLLLSRIGLKAPHGIPWRVSEELRSFLKLSPFIVHTGQQAGSRPVPSPRRDRSLSRGRSGYCVPGPHSLAASEVPDYLGREHKPPHHCPRAEGGSYLIAWPSSPYVTRPGSQRSSTGTSSPPEFSSSPVAVGMARVAQGGASRGWSCVVPLLVLGHQKREGPGDKAVTGLLSSPHSGGGRSVTG